MKQLVGVLLIYLMAPIDIAFTQQHLVNHDSLRIDLNQMLNDLESSYVYFEDKHIDISCLRDFYSQRIKLVSTKQEALLLFEYLLDEFYDSHLMLNANSYYSYRLHSPVYCQIREGDFYIQQVWLSQISNLDENILGAKVLTFNHQDFDSVIDSFPTHCQDKNNPIIREWIANKVLAGRYSETRKVKLALADGKQITINLDSFNYHPNSSNLSCKKIGNFGYIRINNSLGNNDLIRDFDHALDSFIDTDGLILDLRNTVGGGNTYVARGIMGRFITERLPYQVHWIEEQYGSGPKIPRSWQEFVTARAKTYHQPVIVLVGRWTGSMGEGLAIGLEALDVGLVVGTEMERLAGSMYGIPFFYQNYQYRIAKEKIFHVNGIAREAYIPKYYVPQHDINKDEALEKALKILKKKKPHQFMFFRRRRNN